MEFRILGPVHVWTAGQEDTLSGTKQRTTFAALVLAGGRVLSDEHLSRMLWDENPPNTAGAQIHTYASRIRRRLGPDAQLIRIRSGYRLVADQIACDHREFAHRAADGLRALREQSYERAAEELRAALALWRGEALADVTDQLIDTERPQLEETRLEALEGWIEAELILGRHRGLIPELTRLVSQHPMREQFRALLMTALYRSERQAEAMSLYLDGRRILAEELGVEPGRLLVRTYEAILSGEVRTLMPHQLVG
ncbi:DNA-binding SARP family transcriptional activator [Kitasatospora gansuensis]|uniref:DNA-binding SARP family transcriptional activator n=1 Tax=Kitasatospora gansuensis TaxID=258050 RepID=A0A7W7SD53_9ACTN|nr:AfsR/SARP family transcriptional regulator [Kitasatospora gansuensis]MBB4948288.1 DNA-binding SARP family transcriptional activator [Kitasatospora gansuensis]